MQSIPTSLIKVCSTYITPKKERNIMYMHVAEMQVFRLCTRTEPKKICQDLKVSLIVFLVGILYSKIQNLMIKQQIYLLNF